MSSDDAVWEMFQQALMLHLDNWHKLRPVDKLEVLANGQEYVKRLYSLPSGQKPVDIHPSVLKAQYRYGV